MFDLYIVAYNDLKTFFRPVEVYSCHATILQRQWYILPDGLAQLGSYLDKLGLPCGRLLIFDRRLKRKWENKIFRREDIALPEPYEHLRAIVWGF